MSTFMQLLVEFHSVMISENLDTMRASSDSADGLSLPSLWCGMYTRSQSVVSSLTSFGLPQGAFLPCW